MTDAQEIIARGLAEGGTACVTSSFQAECVVLVHMLREVRPDMPVLFLDTVHHFPQTYAYRDEIASAWHLNLVNLRAAVPEPGLWKTSTKACCGKHKVEPLVWAYAKAHAIPLLPLYELGYTSIGCEPCTSLPLDPNNPRSGRWQGEKLECGIHIQTQD